jgi:hypothetical protein
MLISDVAEVVFNKCTTISEDAADSHDFTVTLDYEFVEDIYAEWVDTVGDDVSIASDVQALMEPDNVSMYGGVDGPSNEYRSIDTKTEEEKLRDLERKKNHPLMLMVSDICLSYKFVREVIYGNYRYDINYDYINYGNF